MGRFSTVRAPSHASDLPELLDQVFEGESIPQARTTDGMAMQLRVRDRPSDA